MPEVDQVAQPPVDKSTTPGRELSGSVPRPPGARHVPGSRPGLLSSTAMTRPPSTAVTGEMRFWIKLLKRQVFGRGDVDLLRNLLAR